jgi:hypothetical protein
MIIIAAEIFHHPFLSLLPPSPLFLSFSLSDTRNFWILFYFSSLQKSFFIV